MPQLGKRESASKILCLSTEQLSPILERKRFSFDTRTIPRIPLDALLIDILDKANEFVPSSAGSILLDDPIQKFEESGSRELIFVCCFGPTAEGILGLRVPIDRGIVGSVYRTGNSQVTRVPSARLPLTVAAPLALMVSLIAPSGSAVSVTWCPRRRASALARSTAYA